jgi:transposase-like protein
MSLGRLPIFSPLTTLCALIALISCVGPGDDTQPHRQRYRCTRCSTRFDDLTGTALAGHHQPLRVWVLCLYFMGLNLSNRQIILEYRRSCAISHF